MKKRTYPARVGVAPGRFQWVMWNGRRMLVRDVLLWWDEPAAPWDGMEERHYARLLLEAGAVLELYMEGDVWMVCGVED